MQYVKFNFAMYFEFSNPRYVFRIYHVNWIFTMYFEFYQSKIVTLVIILYIGNLSIPTSFNIFKNFQ